MIYITHNITIFIAAQDSTSEIEGADCRNVSTSRKALSVDVIRKFTVIPMAVSSRFETRWFLPWPIIGHLSFHFISALRRHSVQSEGDRIC